MKQLPMSVELAIQARRKRQRSEPGYGVPKKGSPATMKQLSVLGDLRADFDLPLEGIGNLTMGEANAQIKDLKHRRAQRRRAQERSRNRKRPVMNVHD